MRHVLAYVVISFLFLPAVSTGQEKEEEEFPMYLCMDPNHNHLVDGKWVKMVYTKIDGEKTRCMAEREFILKYRAPKNVPSPPPPAQQHATKPARKDFRARDFSGQDLMDMNFENADLRNADFRNADMRGVNLKGADLRGANLQGAYLKHANLCGADLTDTQLKGTYFTSADLTEAKGLSIDNIRYVQTLYDAKLDSYLLADVKQYCPAKFRDADWRWGVPESNKRGRRDKGG